jgi:hypothetical protein
MAHWFDDFDHGILSPSGRVSNRTRSATEARLRENVSVAIRALPSWAPPQPTRAESLRRQAAELRVLASRGMCVRKYPRLATAMEAEADRLEHA